MSERNYYVICDDGCEFPAMTKEQILTAIQQAVESHEITDVDSGFVTTLKEQNANKGVKFWFGTSAQFAALETKQSDTLYILTDDDTMEGIEALQEAVTKILDGTTVVPKAAHANSATSADKLNAQTYYPDYQVTKTGLYLINIKSKETNNLYTAILFISSLESDFIWSGGYYNGNNNACVVFYDKGTKKISIDNTTHFTLAEIRLIEVYAPFDI